MGRFSINSAHDSQIPLTRYAWLSIAAALITIALKGAAYLYSNSMGFPSDAAETLVNLIGAVVALAMLSVAARLADDKHTYGHSQAEYFSSGIEGSLILIAVLDISVAAVRRLITPQPLEELELGIMISAAASLVNLVVGSVVIRTGKRHGSSTLEANGKHLMTDVWTSLGVLAGVGAVFLIGWNWLDPVAALAVAGNIIFTEIRIVHRSALGLLDPSLPLEQHAVIEDLFDTCRQTGIDFHALRSRQAGHRVG